MRVVLGKLSWLRLYLRAWIAFAGTRMRQLWLRSWPGWGWPGISSSNSCRLLTGIERAEHWVVYVDEIDKIAKKSENVTVTFQWGVQQAPSQDYPRGTVASVPPPRWTWHPQQEMIQVDTKNIPSFIVLVLLMASKKSLNNVWEKKLHRVFGQKQAKAWMTIALMKSSQKTFKNCIPELIGPHRLALLSSDGRWFRILKGQKCLGSNTKHFSYDDVELGWRSKPFKKSPAKPRTRSSLIEETMLDVMFEVPSQKY